MGNNVLSKSLGTYLKQISDAYKNIVKNFNKDLADRLLISNPKCVLEDKDISKMPIVKKKFLGLF